MNFLRIILFPLVPVYAIVVKLRNLFFDKNIFKAKGVNAKVISVGNITIGGSGKTPMVMYLVNLFRKEGSKVGVLSRGYGRKSSGYLLVSDGEKILAPVDYSGDEMYNTVSEYKIPAAVAENRVKGAVQLLRDTGIDIILLDDAFQHRWIYRDIDILIFEQSFLIEENLFNQNLLPAGNMREPFESAKRADTIIINRKFSEVTKIPEKLQEYFKNKRIFTAYYKTIGFVDVVRNNHYGIEEFKGQKSLIVSGIAKPFSLINILKQTKVDTQNQLIFKDHKNYTLREIKKIRKQFYSTNANSVVTTQKDAVKLSKFSKELDDIDIYYLKIELKMDDEESFRNYLLDRLSFS
jgi:tetraacyldisaccharide 4'-kinase